MATISTVSSETVQGFVCFYVYTCYSPNRLINQNVKIMSRFFNLLVTVAILGAVFYACKSKSDLAPGPVDPNDPNALSKVLIFTNGTKQNSGTLPNNASSAKTTITNSPSLSVSTSGGTVYIPVAYSGSVSIAYAYIQVQGASTYFTIPINASASTGQFAIPVTLPATLQGNFVLLLQLVDANGNVACIKKIGRAHV